MGDRLPEAIRRRGCRKEWHHNGLVSGETPKPALDQAREREAIRVALKGGPKTVEELAAVAGLSTVETTELLRAMMAINRLCRVGQRWMTVQRAAAGDLETTLGL